MVYLIFGLIPITIFLFFLSTHSGLSYFENEMIGIDILSVWQITIGTIALLITALALIHYAVSKKMIFKSEAIILVFLLMLFSIIALIQNQKIYIGTHYEKNLTGIGIAWAALFNIVAFLEIIGIIFFGYLKKEDWLINLGVFSVFIFIFIKYFDWFFSFLDKSIFFIGAGGLLFAMGWFMEKGKKYISNAAKNE